MSLVSTGQHILLPVPHSLPEMDVLVGRCVLESHGWIGDWMDERVINGYTNDGRLDDEWMGRWVSEWVDG